MKRNAAEEEWAGSGSGTGTMTGGVDVWDDDELQILGALIGPMTQREVADILGISKTMVVKIEQRALRKLRTGLGAEYAALQQEES
jgi:hypothetical protein